MKTNIPLIIFLIFSISTYAQQKIEVADNTIKVGALKEKVFHYGFAEGDQIVFSFEEKKGKKLKEVEIVKFPNSSIFMDFKSKKVSEKVIKVTETGIYKFRFSNTAVTKRVCKIKIHRIPTSEKTIDFNTNVFWRTEYDTTYYTVQEKYLIRSDTIINNLMEQTAKVHSTMNPNGNKTNTNFILPPNTITWSYYVGVGQEGQKAFQDAVKKTSKTLSPLLSKIPGYGPLAGIALGSAPLITTLQKGEDVDYYLTDNNNANLFDSGSAFRYYKQGKIINTFSKMTAPLKGSLSFCLKNDNAIKSIMVHLRVTAIQVNETWGTRPITKMKINSQKVPYLKN